MGDDDDDPGHPTNRSIDWTKCCVSNVVSAPARAGSNCCAVRRQERNLVFASGSPKVVCSLAVLPSESAILWFHHLSSCFACSLCEPLLYSNEKKLIPSQPILFYCTVVVKRYWVADLYLFWKLHLWIGLQVCVKSIVGPFLSWFYCNCVRGEIGSSTVVVGLTLWQVVLFNLANRKSFQSFDHRKPRLSIRLCGIVSTRVYVELWSTTQ